MPSASLQLPENEVSQPPLPFPPIRQRRRDLSSFLPTPRVLLTEVSRLAWSLLAVLAPLPTCSPDKEHAVHTPKEKERRAHPSHYEETRTRMIQPEGWKMPKDDQEKNLPTISGKKHTKIPSNLSCLAWEMQSCAIIPAVGRLTARHNNR